MTLLDGTKTHRILGLSLAVTWRSHDCFSDSGCRKLGKAHSQDFPFSSSIPVHRVLKGLQERQRTWNYSRSCKAVEAYLENLEQTIARAAEARAKALEEKAKERHRIWKPLMSMSEFRGDGNMQGVGPVDPKLNSEVRRCFYFLIQISSLKVLCPSCDRRFWIKVSVSRSNLKLSAPATEPSPSRESHRLRLPA